MTLSVKVHRHAFAQPVRWAQFIMWCECAHCHTIEPIYRDGVYQTIPWPRWHVEPGTSTVSMIEVPRLVCTTCYDRLPE